MTYTMIKKPFSKKKGLGDYIPPGKIIALMTLKKQQTKGVIIENIPLGWILVV